MRPAFVALCLAISSRGSAQSRNPTPPPPPIASASITEMRVGGFLVAGERAYDYLNTVENASGPVTGFDALFRKDGLGISLRIMSGAFAHQPSVAGLDVRVHLFPPPLSMMFGFGRRATWSDVNASAPTRFDYRIAGISSAFLIGGSGAQVKVDAAMWLPAGDTRTRLVSGFEGEASLQYAFKRWPMFVQAGYRLERLSAKGTTAETPEHMRGIRLGGGVFLPGSTAR